MAHDLTPESNAAPAWRPMSITERMGARAAEVQALIDAGDWRALRAYSDPVVPDHIWIPLIPLRACTECAHLQGRTCGAYHWDMARPGDECRCVRFEETKR